MNTIFILLPLAVFLSLIGLVLLIWSVKRGQFDDLEGPAHRILFEDDAALVPNQKKQPKDK
ncbi:MAG: cbb3-type cytochrome oxidase assembly protein CcoS [Magnetococcales bacterium]|nr:cbb3-type cytochrome oxidase assembly protein CcoS [Magnetococcales bacterium]NGZ04801.1 cbb3-type cytochrome oxidase assembly protein CcoS [Magnetococcales bacterium]